MPEESKRCLLDLADSEDVQRELVLRCMSLLGLSHEHWCCSNAAAASRLAALADVLPADLAPILPSWRPPGIPQHVGFPQQGVCQPPGSGDIKLSAPSCNLEWLTPLAAYDSKALHHQQQIPGSEESEGTAAAGGTGVKLSSPWYLATEERRQFVVRLLKLLALGRLFRDDARLAQALVWAEAAVAQQQPSGEEENPEGHKMWDLDRALAAAQDLLALHRDSVPLWQAYASLLVAADQYKV